MNLVILEVTGNKAVALTSDGQFISIKARRGMRPGCEFAYEEPARPRAGKLMATIAAAFVLLAMSSAMWQTFAVATRVDIEINPAVRMCVNAYGLVIRTEALNDDGRALLAGMRTSAFATVEETAARIISRAIDDGYLKPEGSVSITVEDSDPARAQAKEAALFDSAVGSLQGRHVPATVKTRKASPKAQKEPDPQTPAESGGDWSKSWHSDGSDATPAPDTTAAPDKKGEDAKPGKSEPGPKETKDAAGDKKDGDKADQQDKDGKKPERTKKPDSKADPDSNGKKEKKGRSA